MKTALVYDRVNKWGGAERVLLVLHEMFPEAPLYTSVYDPDKAAWAKIFPKVKTSFLQKLPFAKNNHELLAPLMPMAFEQFNFDEYDLVISVTSEAAKGIITKQHTRHICYLLTPTRYLWSGYEEYFKNKFIKLLSKPVVNYLRNWDKVAASRPDSIISISSEVKKRTKKYYGRESQIIFPPVHLESGSPINKIPFAQEYFLVVGRLVPYKRTDLAVKAFNELGFNLIIIGQGNQKKYLKYIAKDNIYFPDVEQSDDDSLIWYLKNAKALIFPQIEDFGIVPVEAQLMGTPIIAYKKGGAIDTVIDGKTGIFFEEQSEGSLIKAVKTFQNMSFDDKILIQNAKKFSKRRFREKFEEIIKNI